MMKKYIYKPRSVMAEVWDGQEESGKELEAFINSVEDYKGYFCTAHPVNVIHVRDMRTGADEDLEPTDVLILDDGFFGCTSLAELERCFDGPVDDDEPKNKTVGEALDDPKDDRVTLIDPPAQTFSPPSIVSSEPPANT